MGVVMERVNGIIWSNILMLKCKGYLAIKSKYILDGAWHCWTTVIATSMVENETISNVHRISGIYYPIYRMLSMEHDTALSD